MGRASRNKRARRGIQAAPALTKALVPYTRDSLLALLDAAASSPGAVHHQPSVEYALFHVLARQASGSQIAEKADLRLIVDAAHSAMPDLAMREDYTPLDPRLQVVARWQVGCFG